MANKQEFKFIKGNCAQGAPVDIYFYTDVDYWSVDSFLWEFDYLVNHVQPSQIRIHINSVGGSVIDGMSVFSRIISCKIPTQCINDSLAASMGSVIWAAGDELFMRDYALLMIHNPFCDCGGEKEYNQATEAFAQQLKTIYMKRFEMSEDEVLAIMDGKEGDDGTFLTAQEAVNRGFVKPENIIETPKAIKDQIEVALKGITDVASIKAVLDLANRTIEQPIKTQYIDKIITKPNSKTMEDQINVFAALFGLTGEKATADNVSEQIKDLKAKAEKLEATEQSLQEVQSQLAEAQAKLTGAETSVKNLTIDFEAAKTELKKYQDAEAEAKHQQVNALIDKAIEDCKISKEERETYAQIAESNYDLAVNILSKIPARDNLGQIIANAGKEEAKDGMKSQEAQLSAIVDEVVGKDFAFRSLE